MHYFGILSTAKIHQDEEQIFANTKNRGELWKGDFNGYNMCLVL